MQDMYPSGLQIKFIAALTQSANQIVLFTGDQK